jgi:hypothetical protein
LQARIDGDQTVDVFYRAGHGGKGALLFGRFVAPSARSQKIGIGTVVRT